MRHDLRLITIPFSHYCEKARWALDLAGLRYKEEPYLPMLAWLPALRAGGSRTVPVLVTPDDGALTDSTEILRWIDRNGGAPPLFPSEPINLADEVLALEDEYDRRLGPITRRVGYAMMLPSREATFAMFGSVPRWQARVVGATFPLARALMSKGLRLDDGAVERARKRVDDAFADVALRLRDGRRYLTGDDFTAADLTFAALAAPMVVPPAYACRLAPPELWPAAMVETVDRLRATPTGEFVRRVYADNR